jgi:alkylation response protein AidB-like acyl-CoA dehydrogenase
MNFGRDAAEEDLIRRIGAEIAAQLSPSPQPVAAGEPFSREEWMTSGRLGLLGMGVPEPYGRLRLGARMSTRVLRVLGACCSNLGLGFSIASHAFGCARPIFEYGSEEFRAAMLPRLVSGEAVGALAITEPGAGSDIAAIQCRAVRSAGGYLLTGEKCYITNAPVGDIFLVFAKTEPRDAVLGISAFVVERGAPGLEVTPPVRKIGLDGSPMGSIRLTECPVDADRLLATEGCGRQILTGVMRWERTCMSGLFLGMLDRQLAEVIEYARTRKQFGRSIGSHQAVAHRIANMYMRRGAAELLVEQAAWMLDEGGAPDVDACVAKLTVAEAAVQSSLDSVQIFGAPGVLSERGIERYLRDAVMAPLFAGTPEILRDTIAAHLLG